MCILWHPEDTSLARFGWWYPLLQCLWDPIQEVPHSLFQLQVCTQEGWKDDQHVCDMWRISHYLLTTKPFSSSFSCHALVPWFPRCCIYIHPNLKLFVSSFYPLHTNCTVLLFSHWILFPPNLCLYITCTKLYGHSRCIFCPCSVAVQIDVFLCLAFSCNAIFEWVFTHFHNRANA